jgi:hypothetical protein
LREILFESLSQRDEAVRLFPLLRANAVFERADQFQPNLVIELIGPAVIRHRLFSVTLLCLLFETPAKRA